MEQLTQFDLVYLATPYSKYPRGIRMAYVDASALAGELLKRGVKVYSPIAHTHSIAEFSALDPLDHNIWLPFDETIMSKSDALAIGMLDGWERSYGIAHEVEYFRERGGPVFYVDPISLRVIKQEARRSA